MEVHPVRITRNYFIKRVYKKLENPGEAWQDDQPGNIFLDRWPKKIMLSDGCGKNQTNMSKYSEIRQANKYILDTKNN